MVHALAHVDTGMHVYMNMAHTHTMDGVCDCAHAPIGKYGNRKFCAVSSCKEMNWNWFLKLLIMFLVYLI